MQPSRAAASAKSISASLQRCSSVSEESSSIWRTSARMSARVVTTPPQRETRPAAPRGREGGPRDAASQEEGSGEADVLEHAHRLALAGDDLEMAVLADQVVVPDLADARLVAHERLPVLVDAELHHRAVDGEDLV